MADPVSRQQQEWESKRYMLVDVQLSKSRRAEHRLQMWRMDLFITSKTQLAFRRVCTLYSKTLKNGFACHDMSRSTNVNCIVPHTSSPRIVESRRRENLFMKLSWKQGTRTHAETGWVHPVSQPLGQLLGVKRRKSYGYFFFFFWQATDSVCAWKLL
jgi:hypothetical protein